MIRTIPILLLFVLLLSFFSCQSNSSQIEDCFKQYKLAILDHNGTSAIKLIDKATIDYYSQVLDKVKMLDSSQLAKESLMIKFEILKIRHTTSRKEILSMNGKTLLTSLINRGISNNGNIAGYKIGEMQIKNDSAIAEKISNNKKTPFQYLFLKEEGSWKIRMHASNTTSDAAIKQLALNEGMTDNDYIFKLLESISDAKPSQEIWKPTN